jgi:hypothetical protein
MAAAASDNLCVRRAVKNCMRTLVVGRSAKKWVRRRLFLFLARRRPRSSVRPPVLAAAQVAYSAGAEADGWPAAAVYPRDTLCWVLYAITWAAALFLTR